MPVNRVAENVLGTIGTLCWTAQILPQNWKSWREHSTDGLSAYLVFIWASSAIFLGIYMVTLRINIPLMVQPQTFGFLTALSWTQCLYYTYKRSFSFCLMALIAFCLIGGGFQAGMVFVCRHALDKGNDRPVQFFGIFSSVLIAIGFLPQYWEIWKRNEVVGVSYIFIVVDTLGGVFSLLSLIFKPQLDAIATVTYSIVILMDSAILIAAIVLNPRAKRRRERINEDISASTTVLDENESPRRVTPEPPHNDVEKQSIKATNDSK